MDFYGPLDKKGKETLTFKDRFTCTFNHQVSPDAPSLHDRPDLLLRMWGAPWMRPLSAHLGYYTPGRVQGAQGAEQGEGAQGAEQGEGAGRGAGVEGARARDHSGGPQGQPQGHSLSNLRFTGFSGYLFRCYFCMVSRKINTRIPT